MLIVDDNDVSRLVTTKVLSGMFCTVDTARNGDEAVRRATERTYDVIVMDVQMPVMDGLEATRRIRALPHGAHVPILALTAGALVEDRARCLEAGMSDYLAKPIRPRELYESILAWVDRPRSPVPPSSDPEPPAPAQPASLELLRQLEGLLTHGDLAAADLARQAAGELRDVLGDQAQDLVAFVTRYDFEQAATLLRSGLARHLRPDVPAP